MSLGVKVGDTLHMVHLASGVRSSLVRVGQEEEQQIQTAGESDPADRYKTSHNCQAQRYQEYEQLVVKCSP